MSQTMVNPELRRKIKVKVRPDIIIKKQRHAGQTFFIVKDPVAFKYYRFREEELFLLKQFNGEQNFDDVRHEFVEKFRPQRLSVVELEKFVQQLLQSGLASADTPQLGQRLYERFRKRRIDKLKGFFANILNVKFSLFDPDRLLERMLKYVGFLFHPAFFALICLFWFASISLVLVNWDEFISKLPSYDQFFTPKNIIYFWVTLAIVKILHEFGHGLSCKYFGGEVHEMGLLFMVMTPCLYANVTDSWMLPNKWHRVIIGAAGMYVEFIIAGVAVWTWWYTVPGFLNTLCLTVIFICSVSTFMFNANPLLRFDGYYILSDLIEIPNLRERSNRLLGNLAGRVFLGTDVVDDPFMPKQNKWFFLTYAIASYFYRWLVTFGILFFFYNLLKPYKLATISAILATLSLIPLLILPIWNTIRTVRNRWRTLKVNKVRFVVSAAAALLVIVAIALAPLPHWVDVPCVIQARNARPIYVNDAGSLHELFAIDQQRVKSGDRLAVMKQQEVDLRVEQLTAEVSNLKKEVQQANRLDSQARSMARSKLAAAERTLEEYKRSLERMTLKVPAGVEGAVLSPPRREEIGRQYRVGEMFCQIGDPKDLEAFLVVPHSDLSLVRSGQSVSLKFDGHVGSIVRSSIESISADAIKELPPMLSNRHGGEVPTKPVDPNSQGVRRDQQTPIAASYGVVALLPNETGTWRPGLRGYARVHLPPMCIYERAMRSFFQTWNFKL